MELSGGALAWYVLGTRFNPRIEKRNETGHQHLIMNGRKSPLQGKLLVAGGRGDGRVLVFSSVVTGDKPLSSG